MTWGSNETAQEVEAREAAVCRKAKEKADKAAKKKRSRSWDSETWVAILFIAFWIGGALLTLGFTGLIIWAIIRFVLKYT